MERMGEIRGRISPQFLFPAGSRFGGDNLVLHAAARKHVVSEFAGPLSIKTVMRGQVEWLVAGRACPVDSNAFLVLEDGQRYSMKIDTPEPVETCCAFFRSGFVEEIACDATTPLEMCLDSPWRDAPPLHFLSRLHPDPNRRMLSHMWSLAERCGQEIQPSGYEEDFLLLSHRLLGLYREIKTQMLRVPGSKASTREELFRRLQIAREFLHSNVDRRISLEEISREACVSRYHLLRAFQVVFRQTPHAYLTALRLERARSLLQSGHSVTTVAMDVGFTSVSAFTRRFRSRFGVPPSGIKNRKIGQAQR
jgi:AraC family transcriptional regulator